MTQTVAAYFPLPSDFSGISYTCLSLCENMGSAELDVELITPVVRKRARRPFVRPLVPQWIPYFPFRWVKPLLVRWADNLVVKESASKDAVYLWSDVSLGVAEGLKEAGVLVIREKFNCHKAYAKRILDEEYARLGMPVRHRITETAVAKERRELELTDFVFSPSPMVKQSLLEEGVSEDKIIDSSYGWEPDRFRISGPSAAVAGRAGVKVVFVGRLCVRKGVHLLLQYWEEAGIGGELLLAGAVDEEISERFADQLGREDVTVLGHVGDVGELYRDADIFVFPSLEEGGPLVTYEAMGCGLPVVVSPMGGGAVVSDGVHGFVREPHDALGWVECLRRLAGSKEMRKDFGSAGARELRAFTWSEVGKRRGEAIVDLIRVRNDR